MRDKLKYLAIGLLALFAAPTLVFTIRMWLQFGFVAMLKILWQLVTLD